MSMMLATLLLIGATVSFYFVSNQNEKLGLIALYTLLFAMSMRFCTNAGQAEIPGTTATYAAVLAGSLLLP
jgi:amino acid transporter